MNDCSFQYLAKLWLDSHCYRLQIYYICTYFGVYVKSLSKPLWLNLSFTLHVPSLPQSWSHIVTRSWWHPGSALTTTATDSHKAHTLAHKRTHKKTVTNHRFRSISVTISWISSVKNAHRGPSTVPKEKDLPFLSPASRGDNNYWSLFRPLIVHQAMRAASFCTVWNSRHFWE